MAKDEGKNLGYHWRRAAGIYDAPDRPTNQPKGNASTTTTQTAGITGATTTTASTTTLKITRDTTKKS